MFTSFSYSWDKLTHIMIGKFACFILSDSLGFPDDNKKNDETTRNDHYSNLAKDSTITTLFIKHGLKLFNSDSENYHNGGELYSAIIHYVRDYIRTKNKINLVFAGHLIGDLSNPLHNIVYDDFNKLHHKYNDDILKNCKKWTSKITYKNMYIYNEADLIRHITNIAKSSQKLGYKLEKKNRDMTCREAKIQISQSISLFRAVLNYVQKFDRRMKLFQCDSKHRNQPCK
jgi:hypothetical protein